MDSSPKYEYSFHITEIIPGKMFLGDKIASSDLKLLRSRKIEVIVNTARGVENRFPNEYEYKNFRINDSPTEDLYSHLKDFCVYMDEKEKKGKVVFVHCIAGVSRSASFVIAYLMWKNKYKLEKAFDVVLKKRSHIYPENFREQLEKWEETLEKGKDNQE